MSVLEAGMNQQVNAKTPRWMGEARCFFENQDQNNKAQLYLIGN